MFFFFFLFPARFETEAAGPRTAGVRPLLTQICLRYYKWFEAVGGGSGRPGLSHTARCISIRDSWPQGQLKQEGWRRGPGLRKSPIIVCDAPPPPRVGGCSGTSQGVEPQT